MHTSGGNGGFCDCGDAEAWKKDPCCEVHLKGNNYDSEDVSKAHSLTVESVKVSIPHTA